MDVTKTFIKVFAGREIKETCVEIKIAAGLGILYRKLEGLLSWNNFKHHHYILGNFIKSADSSKGTERHKCFSRKSTLMRNNWHTDILGEVD